MLGMFFQDTRTKTDRNEIALVVASLASFEVTRKIESKSFSDRGQILSNLLENTTKRKGKASSRIRQLYVLCYIAGMFTRLHTESDYIRDGKSELAGKIALYLFLDYNDSILVYVIMQSAKCDLHGRRAFRRIWMDETAACNRYRVHDE